MYKDLIFIALAGTKKAPAQLMVSQLRRGWKKSLCMFFQGLADIQDLVQPLVTGFIPEPGSVQPMLRVLYALQFVQKQLQVGLCDYKRLDVVFNWIEVFTAVIIYDKFPCAVVVAKTLRN